MPPRTRDDSWIAGPGDMLEKLHHDRERLRDGISNLRDDPREAHYAAYDFFITAWHTANNWLMEPINQNELFGLAQDIANGVKHFNSGGVKEETYDKGDFSQDFHPADFDTDDLYLKVDDAEDVREDAEAEGLEPKGIVQDETKVSVSVLSDRLIECLKEKIQGRSP
jgi:hypothetical protein